MRHLSTTIALTTFISCAATNVLGCNSDRGASEETSENGETHGDGHDHNSHSTATASDPRAAEGTDWCSEHGVPESMCTQCNPGLSASFRESDNWCGEHDFPESICPDCNPVAPPTGASGPQTRIYLSEEAIEASGIRVESVTIAAMSPTFDIPSEVQFDPDRLAHINALVDGQIVSVNVTVGDRVQVGDELATFRSVGLGQARADLIRATAIRDAAQRTLERQERLREEGISSERNLLEAQLAFDEADAARDAARSRLRVFGVRGGAGSDMILSSPIEGVVVERHATRGENVSPEDTLFVIADATEVWVIGRLYEIHISQVATGMGAILTMSAHPGRHWSGVVEYVALSMDETSRTLPIRVPISNDDGALRPGMFGTLTLGGNAGGQTAVTVPIEAIQTLDHRDVIFVSGEYEGTFEARTVILGPEADGFVSVLDGLSSDNRVVVEGGFILKSELVRGQLADGCGGD